MAEKELRKMSRTELIEIIYALKTREGQLMQEKQELEEQLRQRAIKLDKAGSIAEAALSLNRVFEAAQQAADDYLLSLKGELAEPRNEIPAPEPEEKEEEPEAPPARSESVLIPQGADEIRELLKSSKSGESE